MLKKLKVQNYKSIENLEIDFDRNFYAFIGPNNSGKSNILDCLSFLSEIFLSGNNTINNIINRRGNYENIVFGGDSSRVVDIAIELELDKKKFEYSLSFLRDKITLELLKVEDKQIFYFVEGKGSYFDERDNRTNQLNYQYNYIPSTFLSDIIRHKTIISFKEYIKKWRIYSFIPMNMRGYSSPIKSFDPGKSGEKTAQVLYTLLTSKRPSFDKIKETLTSVINEMEDINLPPTEDGRIYIAIKERNFDKPFDSSQLSDGTLKIISSLSVLLSPEPPPLICFEEPENYIHPRLLEFLAEVIKKADTQVLITTHSPYLLNFLDVDDLIIIEKIDGKTTAKKIPDKENLKKKMKELGFTVGELWYHGEFGGIP